MIDMTKEAFINGIIDREGGYVNDPSDSGGETNFGITKTVARAYGFTDSMKYMHRSIAYEIYEDRYWNRLNLDIIASISPEIAEELADTGVNMGVVRAGEFLQRCLNVLNNRETHYSDIVVDGKVGNKTLDALRAFKNKRGLKGLGALYKMLNCLQGAFYIELAERREKDEKFLYGWIENRVR